MESRSRGKSERVSLLRWIGFGLAVFLFLFSLLAICSAPTTLLWFVAIVVGEWGHLAVIPALLVAVLFARVDRLGLITALLAVFAAALFASPAIRALRIGRTLPERCTSAFGAIANLHGRASPLNLLDLFRGVETDDVGVTEHVYATEGSKQLKLDLYQLTRSGSPRPLLIVIHGGSWNGGNKEQLPAINRYLAREGYAVASLDYRHAPKFPFPAAVDDVFRALDYLKANAASLRLDLIRIVLIGRSAGGQIALSAAYSGREPNIRGVIAFYSPSDLVFGYREPSRRGVLDSRKVLEDYLGGSPAEKPGVYAAASPVNFVSAATPPTLLIHGELDPIVWPRQSEQLSERLQAATRQQLYLALPWATHGCDANINGPSGQLSLYAIDRFLAATVGTAPGSVEHDD
jgi:acetyl esterase/lipase